MLVAQKKKAGFFKKEAREMSIKIGIAGYGVVGRHMQGVFKQATIYDKFQGPTEPLNGFDFIFVCVPTPLKNGTLDCSEVENVIRDCDSEMFIVRSTVTVGFVDYLSKKYGKRIVYQPEYIGESPNHSVSKTSQPKVLVLGGEPADRREVIDLYATVYNSNIRIRQLTVVEAEVVKLSENRAILFKLLQMQELYDACEATGVDYYSIREAVYGDDDRFDLGWSFVYPHNRGASSKCIPKDIFAWKEWAGSNGHSPSLTNSLLSYNDMLTNKSYL